MIYINLIPSNVWYLNLRKMLPNEWTAISTNIKERFEWKCFCCGISINQLKNKKYFHAHEYWNFCQETKLISLSAIVCVCSYCHGAIHIGYSSLNNKYGLAVKQIMKVNKWSYSDVKNYVEYSFEEWSKNSTIDWTFDTSSFKDYLTEKQIETVKTYLGQNKINFI